MMEKVRIQKMLSESGVASRRAVEEMILAGRITVNGELVTSLPCFVDPRQDEIRLDNQPVRKRPPPRVYYVLNKPKGVVSTPTDTQGRPRAIDALPLEAGLRVYCVGGMDAETTGLIILTNDGELTQLLTHPKHGISQKFVAEIDGQLSPESIAQLKQGVRTTEGRMPGMNVRVETASPVRSFVELELTNPRHVDIREVLELLGHRVRRLKRVTIGPLTDRGLKAGHYRPLAPREVEHLKQIALRGGRNALARSRPKARPRRPSGGTAPEQ